MTLSFKHRAWAAVSALALAVTGLAGCGSDSDSSAAPTKLDANKKVTITFMHAMSSGKLKSALAEILDTFHKAHPNITVDAQAQPNYGELRTKITAETAAGKPPTIAQVYPDWAEEYRASDVIIPLDKWAQQSKEYQDFFTGVQNDLKLDNKIYMWPFNKSVMVQYYNTQMVPQAPKTWDEFAKVSKDVSKNGVVALSIDPGGAKGISGGTELFLVLAEALGNTPALAADGPHLDGDGAKAAMNYLLDLKQHHALALGKQYPGQAALGSQTGAFDISTVASYQYNLKAVGGKFKMGVAKLPAGKKDVESLAGTNIAVFKSATPEQQAAAWEFMQFLASAPVQAKWAAETGYVPVTKGALDEQVFKDYVAKNSWAEEATKALDNASSLPPARWTTAMAAPLATAITDVINSGVSVDEALAKAQKAAVEIVKRTK